jgi:hypothetical protein
MFESFFHHFHQHHSHESHSHNLHEIDDHRKDREPTRENYDPIDSRNNSPSNDLVTIKTNKKLKFNIKSKLQLLKNYIIKYYFI